MRVLLVSSSSGSRGGGEFYFHALAVGLREKDHDVSVMMSDGTHMDEFAALMESCSDVLRFPYRNTYHRRTRVLGAVFDHSQARAAASLFKSLNPDVVHINKQNLEDGLDLVSAARSSGLPSVATIHVTRSMRNLEAFGGSLRDFVARRALRNARLPLIGTSKQCTVDLHRFLRSYSWEKIHNVTNGAFAVSLERRSHYRNQWRIADECVVLGTLARVEEQKNPLYLCQILRQLPSHVHLVWVGDGRLRPDLEAEIDRQGVNDRFHIDGWRDDARDRISGFDIFVLPSVYEGFPFAVLEAMSAGLPCVVSDVDGTRDSVESYVNGVLLPVNDVPQWTECLNHLINDPAVRHRLGAAARARYELEFSLEAMAQRTVAVYERVIQAVNGCQPSGGHATG